MSVCSGSGIVTDSSSASTESNRQSSTRVPCSEKIAKLTPTPSQVAPSGYGVPGQTRMFVVDTEGFRYHVRGSGCNQTQLGATGTERASRGAGDPDDSAASGVERAAKRERNRAS